MNQLLIDTLLFVAGMAIAFLIIELQYRQDKKRQGR